jgi:hypothetical protein
LPRRWADGSSSLSANGSAFIAENQHLDRTGRQKLGIKEVNEGTAFAVRSKRWRTMENIILAEGCPVSHAEIATLFGGYPKQSTALPTARLFAGVELSKSRSGAKNDAPGRRPRGRLSTATTR